MNIIVRDFEKQDITQAIFIWNEVVEDGIAFPQLEKLDETSGMEFFASQSYIGIAAVDDKVLGLYILHPNNIGRCGHICNASYAVLRSERNNHIGAELVKNSLVKAKELGFKIMQFNAVVRTNVSALHVYKKHGFTQLGIIPAGFLMKDGHYEDIILHYYML